MANNEELQEKAKQFAESVSRYSRAKKLVWGCGIGLWVLACIISLIVFDVQYDAAWNSSGEKGAGALALLVGGTAMLLYGLGIAISALGVVILVICVTTHIIKSKLRAKMTIFMKEMKANGYSKEEVGRSLVAADMPELDVWKCLGLVFGKEEEKK
ncbi:hypothetical protein IKT64_01310 [Candidatus Saccharibacteria bacterium]|nr:hypothetical protein [Candidatus Saccharibacteria bacterium]